MEGHSHAYRLKTPFTPLGRVQNNMPPRAPPKVYQFLLKTHKITIFFTAHHASTIASLKEEALSALTSSVISNPSAPGALHIPTAPGEDDTMMDEDCEVPRVQSTGDFELCRAVKDKGKANAAPSAPPVSYDTLDPSSPIKGLLSNWETLYVQFKDEDGKLLPVQVSQPPLLEDEDEDPRRAPPPQESSMPIGKGKRKAPPE